MNFAALTAVIFVALADTLPAAPKCIAVLMYHEVNTKRKKFKYNIAPKEFEQQMALLNKRGFKTISLDQFHDFAKARKVSLPKKPILIQFDDGRLDVVSTALPIVERYGFQISNFIVTGSVGGKRTQTWKMISELEKKGHHAASHSMSHPYLTKVRTKKKLHRELVGARLLLEKKLKRPVLDFAIPYGDTNSKLFRAIKKAGYRLAYSSASGCSKPSKKRFMIRRYTIHRKVKFKKLLRKIEKKML